MRGITVAVILFAGLSAPRSAHAQAWTPPAGSGTVTVSFQSIDHTGHRLTDGMYIDNGRSRTGALYFDVEYGVTRRLALGIAVPFVWARYTDDDPPPPFLPFLPVDQCRCWHSGWQDVRFGARFNLVDTFDHVLAVTPSVSGGTPSHDYASQGEAVIGRHLNELRVGVDASYRLDAVSRNLMVSGHYAYALVERVLDTRNDRSNATVAVRYRAAGNWSIGALASWQRTHGGLRSGSLPPSDLPVPGDLNTPARIAEHDRLLRDNRVHVGAEVSRRVRQVDVFASFAHFLSGTDTHAGRAVMVGATLPFRLRR